MVKEYCLGVIREYAYNVVMRIIAGLAVGIALLFSPFIPKTFAQESVSIPSSLRGGDIKCDQATVALALELTQQGWQYTMPQPKSPQAMWGNTDGRTTWFVGYWINKTSQKTSSETPVKGGDGMYVGDDKGSPGWRRGGTPAPPTALQWLCSTSGGIPPR